MKFAYLADDDFILKIFKPAIFYRGFVSKLISSTNGEKLFNFACSVFFCFLMQFLKFMKAFQKVPSFVIGIVCFDLSHLMKGLNKQTAEIGDVDRIDE